MTTSGRFTEDEQNLVNGLLGNVNAASQALASANQALLSAKARVEGAVIAIATLHGAEKGQVKLTQDGNGWEMTETPSPDPDAKTEG